MGFAEEKYLWSYWKERAEKAETDLKIALTVIQDDWFPNSVPRPVYFRASMRVEQLLKESEAKNRADANEPSAAASE